MMTHLFLNIISIPMINLLSFVLYSYCKLQISNAEFKLERFFLCPNKIQSKTYPIIRIIPNYNGPKPPLSLTETN